MSTLNPRAEQIFAAALEIPDPAERRAYLVSVCAGDEPMRREVESLLAADEKAGAFLQRPPTVVLKAEFRVPVGAAMRVRRWLACKHDWLVRLRNQRGFEAAVRLAGPFILNSANAP